MLFKVFTVCLIYNVLAYDELVSASNEMIEQGKLQYQLLQERGNLPKYGNCWRQAVEHIDESCKALSEETQSDVALHFTNCFLEMSGHEIYNCVEDKKPNLRGICINSMSDRAFNVYTEFYTHTQNICWFLRGQVWHETIAERTKTVGKQLETSSRTQEELLKNQKESLKLQTKLMDYGLALEKIMQDFLSSTQEHHKLLNVMSVSLGSLQAWILGKISWIDSILFYIFYTLLVIFFTSHISTYNARLPILIMLSINLLLERFICFNMSDFPNDIAEVHENYYRYIWYLRYFFILCTIVSLILSAHFYRDYSIENNKILQNLHAEIESISKNIDKNKTMLINEKLENNDRINFTENFKYTRLSETKENRSPKLFPLGEVQLNNRYNLRSRQGTPEIPV